jgi:3'-phosphoadenosine 5'-phosphosulfate sulfotransferase (PAPS reductase)/FAD synthetase
VAARLEAVRQLAALTDHAILGLSFGKDSVVCLDLLRSHGLRVSAYFQYFVPPPLASFQQKYLEYLWRRYGEFEVAYYPQPDLARLLNDGGYSLAQPDAVPKLSHRETWDAARYRFACRWIVTGEKKIDSLERRAMMSAWGNVQVVRGNAFPIAEWGHREVYGYLKSRRIELAPDYNLFGSSMGFPLSRKVLEPLHAHYPDDYRRLLRIFPLAAAANLRNSHVARRTG